MVSPCSVSNKLIAFLLDLVSTSLVCLRLQAYSFTVQWAHLVRGAMRYAPHNKIGLLFIITNGV
jgi:hypothetical protein